ncbi:MAG: thiamine pyrophosphate-dependent enzyme [Limnochordia bacterium]|jgi:pyruvate ferredoxin oxidoreductase beta subunit
MTTLKELARRPELFTAGHRACAGCGFPQAVRLVLKAAKNPLVVGAATGCLEVTSTIYPYTAWGCSFIHNAFENAAATVSGVEAAYRVLRRRGRVKAKFDFIAFGGDGGTYDIGLQSLSGAMERGHNMLYVCYDNQAYANTGIQRSGATPKGASTTTTPAGRVLDGKPQARKDLTAIMAAHNLPYVAQASVAHWKDLVRKTEKALAVEGPAFINVMAPCRLSWATPPEDTIDLVKHAVDSCFWPLYEVENGHWKLSYKPRERKSYVDWLRRQGRFRHLFQPGKEELLETLEAEVEERWQVLLERCEAN